MSSFGMHGAIAFFVCQFVLVWCKVSIVVVVAVLTGWGVSVVVVVGVVAVESLRSVLIISCSIVVSVALAVHCFGFSTV